MRAKGPSELGIVARPGMAIRRPSPPAPPDCPLAQQSKALTTRIFVRGLQVAAECGVYAHEKGRQRPLVVDIEVLVVPSVRATADELRETVDYDALAAHAHAVAASAHLHLIETYAEQVCDRILEDRRIETVRVRVEKPGSVAGAISSGVEIERGRAGTP
jgi:7,8-dihydroneopterin aldolase/epimerase/oxygenase